MSVDLITVHITYRNTVTNATGTIDTQWTTAHHTAMNGDANWQRDAATRTVASRMSIPEWHIEISRIEVEK